MSEEQQQEEPSALARPIEPPRPRLIGVRILTLEKAQAFADELLSDLSHSIESAAAAVGVKSATIRKALQRARDDSCRTLDDEEICDVILTAHSEHIKQLRRFGFVFGAEKNNAGVAWIQRQLETQAPLEHGRNVGVVEVKASADASGSGESSASARVSYVVEVPQDEPGDEA